MSEHPVRWMMTGKGEPLVPVAFEVAQALHAPLDVFLVRKLGLPGQEELAMGAIATGGVIVLLQTALFALAFLFAPKHGLLAAKRRARA